MNNPKPTTPKPAPKLTPGELVIDGRWGSSTTAALQLELATPIDSVASSKALRWHDANPGLTSG